MENDSDYDDPIRVCGLKPTDLPFYAPVATVLEPVLLPAVPGRKKTTMVEIPFAVPQQYHYYLLPNKDKYVPRYELHLRLFHLPRDFHKKNQPDHFPSRCRVWIDGEPVYLPKILPTNRSFVEAKRLPRPVDITMKCQPLRLPHKDSHELAIEWFADKRAWAAGIYVVEHLDAGALTNKAKWIHSFSQNANITKHKIIRNMTVGDDDGIKMIQVRFSLLCPLGRTRMILPARGRYCTHLQCFDLGLFLGMNEKKPTWKCGICNRLTPYNTLIIDDYFREILQEAKDVEEVELQKDGGYRRIQGEDIYDLSDSDDDSFHTPNGDDSNTKVEAVDQFDLNAVTNETLGIQDVNSVPIAKNLIIPNNAIENQEDKAMDMPQYIEEVLQQASEPLDQDRLDISSLPSPQHPNAENQSPPNQADGVIAKNEEVTKDDFNPPPAKMPRLAADDAISKEHKRIEEIEDNDELAKDYLDSQRVTCGVQNFWVRQNFVEDPEMSDMEENWIIEDEEQDHEKMAAFSREDETYGPAHQSNLIDQEKKDEYNWGIDHEEEMLNWSMEAEPERLNKDHPSTDRFDDLDTILFLKNKANNLVGRLCTRFESREWVGQLDDCLKQFEQKLISEHELYKRVTDIFEGDADLIEEFRAIQQPRIGVQKTDQILREKANSFVNQMWAQFQDRDLVRTFDDCLKEFEEKLISEEEIRDKVANIFEGENDLIEVFELFLTSKVL